MREAEARLLALSRLAPRNPALRFELHHVWFIPLCVGLLRARARARAAGEAPGPSAPVLARAHFAAAAGWVGMLSALTLMILPMPCVWAGMPGNETGRLRCFQLNVNMVQQWWGFDSVRALHMFDRKTTGLVGGYFVFANFVYSLLCNGVLTIALARASNAPLRGAAHAHSA